MKHNKLLSTFCLLLILSGCMFQRPDYLKFITATELNQRMQDQNIFLVDVHIPEQKHIKGTDVFIPFNQIEAFKDKLPANKDTPIYIYCKSGPMGNAAARSLYESGYHNLFNLEGGIDAWIKQGYAVE